MRFCLSLLLYLPLAFTSLFAQNRPAYFEPLPFYDEIKDRLTPIDEVMDGIEAFKDSKKPGIVLLNERFEIVVKDDERYRVDHSIFYVLEQSGIDPVGKDTFRYRKEQESIHLILAHAIQANGTVTPVAENAVFVQSPQKEADSNLYTDYDELVVIFPDIDVGSITEHIVITKEFEPIVENELVNSFYFQFNWPIYLTRYQMDVPDSYAERFQIARVGAGVPTPQITKSNGRTVFEYEDWRREARVWETQRESSSDTGPVERITTFDSWDKVGNWIRGLVNERNTLSDELKAEIDSWTEGLTDRREIIQAVLDPIANEVRYTGLEFGLAGYQPYDCNSVWKQKYGDCKDKANLLASALRHKGIKANVVLIDTDGFGKFDKNSPSPFHFNHAITVVENADGSRLFLDATVENLKVGDLPPRDVNRDVLMILDDRAEIGATQLVSAGQIKFDFDLNLSSDLTLSGWMHMYATGYYGSWYETSFREKTKEGLRWNMHERIDGFFPGAELADASFNPEYDAHTPIASAYFVVKNETSKNASNYSLGLPDVTWSLPSPGEKADGRSTEFPIDKSETVVSVTIKTPASIRASMLPKELNLATPDYQYSGKWWQEENQIKATVSVLNRTDRIVPKNFAQFHQTVGSFNRWWKTPATFSSVEALKAAENKVEEPFPKLSSAVAQLALIEEIYTSDQPTKRRKALEQVIEWFPAERSEIYEANIELVRIDVDRVEPEILAKRIEALISEYEKDITREYLAWGEYLLAQELEKIGKESQALKYFLRHASDEKLSSYRRGWSSYNAAKILRDSNELVSTVKLGMKNESNALNDLAYSLIAYRLRKVDSEALLQDMLEIEQEHPQKFVEILEYVSAEIEEEHDIKDAKALAAWKSVIEPICQRRSELTDCLTALKRIEASLLLESKLTEAGKLAEQHLKRSKSEWYTKYAPPKRVSKTELDEMIRATEKAEEWEKQAALSLSYFIRFPEDVNLASKYLYWAIWNLNNRVSEPSLADILAAAVAELPPANSNIVNGYLSFSKALQKKGSLDKTLTLLEKLSSFEALENEYQSIAHIRMGEVLEEMGRNDEAIQQFLAGGALHFSNHNAYEGLLKCFLLAQLHGDTASALKALQYLSEADSKNLEKAGIQAQARNVIAMSQYPAFSDGYWKRSRELVSTVYDAMDDLSITVADLPNRQPIVYDYEKLGAAIAAANSGKELANYHQKIMSIALAAATNQSDLKTALSLISNNLHSDVVTLRVFKALAELGEYAAYEGSFLQADGIKRLVTHAYLANGDQSKLSTWRQKIASDGKTSDQAIDFATLMLAGHVAKQGILEHESFQMLEERLLVSSFETLRPQAVNLLAAIKMETERYREAKELITAELANPVISANKEVTNSLNAFLDTIRKHGIAGADLSKSVAAFRESIASKWWDHIQPLDTDALYSDGILISNIAQLFQNYSYIEMAKHYLLLAESDREDIETRKDALVEGIRYWQYTNTDPNFVYDQISTIAKDESIDLLTRNQIKVAHLYYLINVRHIELLATLLADKTFLAEPYQKDYQRLLEFLRLPTASVEDCAAAIRFLLEGPFTDTDKDQLRGAITNTVVRFGPQSVEPILKKLGEVTIAEGEGFDITRLKLDALQAKRTAEKLQPFFKLICGPVDLSSQNRATYLTTADAVSIQDLPALMAYQVDHFGYDYDPFKNLGNILFYFNSISAERGKIDLDQVYKEIENLQPSLVASAIVSSVGAGIDGDNREQRDPYLKAIRDFATEKEDPAFAEVHNRQLLQFHSASESELRQPAISFVYPQGASKKYELTYQIIQAQRSGNKSKALSMLQGLDTETLTDPELTFTFFSLARDLGDDPLAELLAEKLSDDIQTRINWSISNHYWMPINYLEAMIAFPEKASSLKWYFEFVATQTKNELILAHNKAALAFSESNWQAVLDSIAEAEAIVPTFWDLKIAQGIARFNLGQSQAAKTDFESYILYRPNSALRRTADRYLQKIDTELAAATSPDPQQPIR